MCPHVSKAFIDFESEYTGGDFKKSVLIFVTIPLVIMLELYRLIQSQSSDSPFEDTAFTNQTETEMNYDLDRKINSKKQIRCRPKRR